MHCRIMPVAGGKARQDIASPALLARLLPIDAKTAVEARLAPTVASG